jgi:hypothetical protein
MNTNFPGEEDRGKYSKPNRDHFLEKNQGDKKAQSVLCKWHGIEF